MTVGLLIKNLQAFNPDLEIVHYAESAPRYSIDAVVYNASENIVCTCCGEDIKDAFDYTSGMPPLNPQI